LNGLFFELLKDLGFNAKRVSARVYNNSTNNYGKEFDHLAIIVTIDQKEYLVDIGFGKFVFKPLQFKLNKLQKDVNGNFLIEKYENEYFKVSKLVGDEKISEYIFTKKARDLNEFEDMCHFHQTSSKSQFTQNRLISKPSKNGQITISGDNLKITKYDKIVFQKTIENKIEFTKCLKKYFDINESEIIEVTNKSADR
jgi:N-hydroxyarylamine O-acetyltransferase